MGSHVTMYLLGFSFALLFVLAFFLLAIGFLGFILLLIYLGLKMIKILFR
ncbi:MAG: hypothetical protein ABRQ39_32765 [Candidatus Eremiobacterota bacterium]